MATSPKAASERNALIVGASRGIGLGLTRELVSRGWRVVATARNATAAVELAQAASMSAGRIAVEEVDIDNAASVSGLVGRLTGRSLELALVNAGVYGPRHQSVDHVTPADMGALVFTNAIAPVRLARQLLPLVVHGGAIAFTSSRMGSVADNLSGGMDLYRASKAALNSITRGFFANDVGDRQLRVLNLHPGWVRTDMGGADAPLEVEESVRGLVDVVEVPRAAGHYFVDYQNNHLPW